MSEAEVSHINGSCYHLRRVVVQSARFAMDTQSTDVVNILRGAFRRERSAEVFPSAESQGSHLLSPPQFWCNEIPCLGGSRLGPVMSGCHGHRPGSRRRTCLVFPGPPRPTQRRRRPPIVHCRQQWPLYPIVTILEDTIAKPPSFTPTGISQSFGVKIRVIFRAK
ncbi:hypothetical protein PYCCODRAFT_1080088 [Trametes coccinea BRFM310]|uniref:Uncharacterized protein n=1 Tax=Trametes coccinea (strain BRFM310) TaxID=1353009 RepID=A0A1Y2IYD3_TRAC3|nr:hypothetical protein PYCCODRAFT_1080088 [Trametes coccinea BRFM310]